MQKRSGFKSSIQEFIIKSRGEILAELTKFREGSLETIQRDAWLEQIVIPEGDEKDPTRQSKFYDSTWEYLKGIGIDVI